MSNKKVVKIGQFLFKYRSITPIPLIIIVLLLFNISNNQNNFILEISFGLLLFLLGELIRILAVGYSYQGTSGRESFFKADNLNIKGIYSIFRNPLYIGNFFIYNGLLVFYGNIGALIFFDFCIITQYYFIIKAEENYLLKKYSDKYKDYCKQVNSILPTFSNYLKNSNKFSWLKVIFKENDSVFNALVIFIVINYFKQKKYLLISQKNNLIFSLFLIFLLIIIYGFIKIIKRKDKFKDYKIRK